MYNYYAINSETGEIVESNYLNTSEVEEWAQDIANEIDATVWVIKGEHSGITVQPESSEVEHHIPRDGTWDTRKNDELAKLAAWKAASEAA